MARWSDLAEWRGPTPNQSGAMVEQRGLVVHVAEGSYEGTIAWQRNPDANVSSHFIVGLDGAIAQMVDTDRTAWTQRAGNGHWLSVENAGHTPHPLTPAQVEANARLLARAHLEYGVPLQLAENPDGKGLGHHSMGCNWPGGAWGHCDCPGPAIIAQKPAILDRAVEIVNGDDMAALTDDVNFWYLIHRVAGLVNNDDPIVIPEHKPSGKPAKSEPNRLAQAVAAAGVTITPEDLAEVTAAAQDGGAQALAGATVNSTIHPAESP